MQRLNLDRAFWQFVIQLPQTLGLLGGMILGWVGLIAYSGTRSAVITAGFFIVLSTLVIWFRTLQKLFSAFSLLEPIRFETQLAVCDRRIPTITQVTWKPIRQRAKATHGFVTQIAQRDPTLIPDLLEALHTVVALVEQVATALQAKTQIQSVTYRPLAQQQLQASCDRLQATHNQLQHLQDQLLLSSSPNPTPDLPLNLRLMIDANKTVL
jgi:hypothetical protein